MFLGIDTGLKNIGWAVINASPKKGPIFVAGGVIELKAKSVDLRALELKKQLGKISNEFGPFLATGYEEPYFYYTDKFGQRRVAGKHKERVAYNTGIILGEFGSQNIKAYNPNTVKRNISGYSLADKQMVSHAVALHLSLPIAEVREMSDHITDAMAVALCRYYDYRREVGAHENSP